jgi:hypothetical protein
MFFIDHLITAIAATLGIFIGLFLSKYRSNKFISFMCWALIFFGIGIFIHVLIFDAPLYDHLRPVPPGGVYTGNETAFEYHIIRGMPWEPLSLQSIIEKMSYTSYENWDRPRQLE